MCIGRLEGLRSKTVLLELELTVLKSKADTDRGTIERLAASEETMQQAIRDLASRLRRVDDTATLLHSMNQGMQDAFDEVTRLHLAPDHVSGEPLASELASARKSCSSHPGHCVTDEPQDLSDRCCLPGSW